MESSSRLVSFQLMDHYLVPMMTFSFQMLKFVVYEVFFFFFFHILTHAEKVLFSMFCSFSHTVMSYLLYHTSKRTAVVPGC